MDDESPAPVNEATGPEPPCLPLGDPPHIYTGARSTAVFTAPARDGMPAVPLVAEPRQDAFGRLGLVLLYSDHAGLEALAPFAELLGHADDPAAIVRNFDAFWSRPTWSIPDASVRAGISKDETVFDTRKYSDDTAALGDHIRDTGRTVPSGDGAELPVMQFLWERRVCDNSGCGNPGVNRCARCKAARYCGKACQKAHWSAGHKYGCTSGWCGVGVPKADLGGGEAQAEPTRDDTELNERLRVWALTKGITKCKFMDGDDDDPLVA